MPYAELHAASAFSFLRGSSLPEQLAEVARELELPALALLDRDGLYGAPRLHSACREHGLRAIHGAELTMEDGVILPVLVENRTGYRNLCQLITRAKLRGTKTECHTRWEELAKSSEGLIALFPFPGRVGVPPAVSGVSPGTSKTSASAPFLGNAPGGTPAAAGGTPTLPRLLHAFGPDRLYVELQRHHLRADPRRNAALIDFARAHRLPLLATNGVRHARPAGRQALDVFTCIRHHTHLDAAGRILEQNSERHLKSGREMTALFADLPEAIANTERLADRLQFTLEDLGYEFPRYPVPAGETMESHLRKITWAGARARYSHLTRKVHRQIEHELDLIGRLGFSGYFLIVWDIVNFCTETGIMVQGRGSAANSAVCYSLGITPVDPVGANLLFERFLSEGRKSWPDIDLDLPSGDRRESVIQEVYRRYGKHGAAMTANVITYRGRSAAREIGKALNFAPDLLTRFSNLFAHGDFPHTLELRQQMEQAGLPREHPRAPAFLSLYQGIYGLPRHLGQHSGGMIICQDALSSVVPLENAAMPGRVVAQWDKDDCADLGIIKVDLLGLGMMSVMQDTIELCGERGHPVDLAQIPKDDPATYDLMCAADTIGVFQIESRAQMATLPRMQPRCFYDVVVEVAIIRPGPIQGNMVHPFLNRRAGKEPVTYFDPRLEPVLERTLGVPLFQEQLLKMAMVMADFTGSEAEELRRALSYHRSQERMNKVTAKLRGKMLEKGVAPEVVDRIVASVSSFAVYGFPESHAISFAILAYGSTWLKVHRAPEFYASLLNNQPMGFYAPATLIKDAKRRGLRIRPVCVVESEWRCLVDADDSLRLGFRQLRGFNQGHALALVEARARRPFASLEDLRRRVPLDRDELRLLAESGALNALAQHRRAALWRVEENVEDDLFSSITQDTDADTPLLPMTLPERVAADYASTELTTGPHPMALLRRSMEDAEGERHGDAERGRRGEENIPASPRLPLPASSLWRACEVRQGKQGQLIRIAGHVICRQRPGSAKGFVFLSLEDETGIANAIILPALFEKHRLLISQEPYLIVEGILQTYENVFTVKARRLIPITTNSPTSASHDFH